MSSHAISESVGASVRALEDTRDELRQENAVLRRRQTQLQSTMIAARDDLCEMLGTHTIGVNLADAVGQVGERLKSQQPPKRGLWVRDGELTEGYEPGRVALDVYGPTHRLVVILPAGVDGSLDLSNGAIPVAWFDAERDRIVTDITWPKSLLATSDDPDELRAHARKVEDPKWSPGDRALMGLDLDSAHVPVTVKSIHGHQAVVQCDGVAGVEVCAVVNLKARGAQ